ncbi:N-acetylmuramoyl-L-alanine amidase CwlD [Marininema halotolerans]|uniref:N-acetylmuramoyl-L-alanine amidase n=1 Tax=Marininema halotolerans TaxID=1155944 RepID=A0A1I6T4R4_9BACL|nr:N-acetylmuramoyl-L-alanine amidase CwlD [Marininema halotolerans]SFS84176.1 N-acetylmuramoyl-L-alanine amidase [Marininema halotolerans]
MKDAVGKWVKKKAFWWTITVSLLFALLLYGYSPFQWSRAVWSVPLAGKTFVLDAGHGGIDGGAVSASGVIEKKIALDITLRVRDYLQEAGALVLLTRETDRDLADEDAKRRKSQDLIRRAELVKETSPDAFISIHLNSTPSTRWSGAQTFYYPTLEANQQLAMAIQSELIRHLDNTKRLARHSGNVYILKTSPVPSALVEVGFLSNPGEAKKLADPTYQQKLAASIYNGIILYYTRQEESAKGSK